MASKLFISHASEDKDQFVRPLAEKLKTRFEVWYDEYSLKLGDSLRTSIDQGLRAADFGVVVLSPRFMAKKWTVAELNAMFALESANRRMILPVWLDLGMKEVQAFSPMLADRYAVNASAGLDHVADAISVAASVSNRSQEILDPDKGKAALNLAMTAIAGQELNEKILTTSLGFSLFQTAQHRIENFVWQRLSEYNLGEVQRFVRVERAGHFMVSGPFGMLLIISCSDLYLNSVLNTKLIAEVTTNAVLRRQTPLAPLGESSWRPTMLTEKELAFVLSDGDGKPTSEEKIAGHIVELFARQIHLRSQQK